MERIKEGVIVIDGIELSAKTTMEDLEKIDMDLATQRDHPHGYLEVLFHHPITSDGVDFRVSMRITKNGKHKVILLDPQPKNKVHGVMNSAREDQEISEQWLKRNIDVPPTRDTDAGIFYDFPWGHIHSVATEHVNFGHLEGGILITYGDDVE